MPDPETTADPEKTTVNLGLTEPLLNVECSLIDCECSRTGLDLPGCILNPVIGCDREKLSTSLPTPQACSSPVTSESHCSFSS